MVTSTATVANAANGGCLDHFVVLHHVRVQNGSDNSFSCRPWRLGGEGWFFDGILMLSDGFLMVF